MPVKQTTNPKEEGQRAVARRLCNKFVEEADCADLSTLSAVLGEWDRIFRKAVQRGARPLGALASILHTLRGTKGGGANSRSSEKNDSDDSLEEATLEELRRRGAKVNGDERDQLFARALGVRNIERREAALLAVCQRLIREDRGCDTPIEMFFASLVGRATNRPLTLDDVREYMEVLQMEWEYVLDTSRKWYREYPELVCGEVN